MEASEARQAAPWLIGAAVLAVPVVLYAGWDWLAASGMGAILLAIAPCAAMCALGLCASRGGTGKNGPGSGDRS